MGKVMDNWASGRPIYDLLPKLSASYEEPVNQWLLDYWDGAFINCAQQLVRLHEYFNPSVCPVEWLDLIAPIYGFSPPYYNQAWSVAAKRTILANAFHVIWPFIGQANPFLFIANALGYKVQLRIPGDFILSGPYESPIIIGSQLGDQMGSRGWELDVLLPVEYLTRPDIVDEIKKLVYLYLPSYLQIEYIFDDQPFYTTLLADIDNAVIIIDNENNALRID